MSTVGMNARVVSQPSKWAPVYSVASAAWIGQREFQEDTLLHFFDAAKSVGFAVISDGMGGHASGGVASQLVAEEFNEQLTFNLSNLLNVEEHVPQYLKAIAEQANGIVRDAMSEDRDRKGMGSTLTAPVFLFDRMYWISVGDSPFYRIRDGGIEQLNADHSMAAEIDLMIEMGMLSEEKGRVHPSRNCLKSAITGGPIRITDCPESAEQILPNDVLILASDGLKSLTKDEICQVVLENQVLGSEAIADCLIGQIKKLGQENQDNVSIAVIHAGAV